MAEKDIKELAGDISKLAEKMNKELEGVLKWMTGQLHKEVVSGTPVLTGWCRANWNISVGEPDYSLEGERARTQTYPEPVTQVPEDPELKPMFVSNGVPYVGLLENGESTKAPVGWVRIAVDKVSATQPPPPSE